MESSIQYVRVYLPKTLHYLSTVITIDSLLKLIKYHGGTRVQIPKKITPCHSLVSLIGISETMKLASIYGGSFLEIPRCIKLISLVRDIKILKDSRKRLSMREMAIKYRMTERGIQKILRRIEPLEKKEWIKEIENLDITK